MRFFITGIISVAFVIPPAVLAKTPDKIKIGLMFGLAGAASPGGPVKLDGAKLAIKEKMPQAGSR